MSLLGNGTIIDRDKNGDNVPQIDQVQSVKIHCNVVLNEYQQDSKLLYTFLPDKQFGQLLVIKSQELLKLKTINSQFTYIEVWFTDQDKRPLQIEENVKVTLIATKNK